MILLETLNSILLDRLSDWEELDWVSEEAQHTHASNQNLSDQGVLQLHRHQSCDTITSGKVPQKPYQHVKSSNNHHATTQNFNENVFVFGSVISGQNESNAFIVKASLADHGETFQPDVEHHDVAVQIFC